MSGLLLPRRLKGSKLSGSFQAYPHANSLQNGTNQAGTLLLLVTCPSRLPAYKGQLAICSLLDMYVWPQVPQLVQAWVHFCLHPRCRWANLQALAAPLPPARLNPVADHA